MYKIIAIVLAIILIIWGGIFAAGFVRTDNVETHTAVIEKPPAPIVRNDKGEQINVISGSYEWRIGNELIIGDNASPCELAKTGNVYNAKPGDTLTYSFEEYLPNEVTIRFWNDEEVLYLTKGYGTIKLPGFEGEYVISISPKWNEGEGVFVFTVKSTDS